jgi:hypothetical protein
MHATHHGGTHTATTDRRIDFDSPERESEVSEE